LIANDAYISSQVMTFAIPLGTFCVIVLIGFFVRKRNV
jgi:hypothetical protein